MKHYSNEGGDWYKFFYTVMYWFMQVCFLMTNIVLQHWSTAQIGAYAGAGTVLPSPLSYFWGYMFWLGLSILLWQITWVSCVFFTTNMSTSCHMQIIKRLVHAPVDRFFDKTPVGRIMNRMSTDMLNLDTQLFNSVTQFFALLWDTMIPMIYVHMLLPT
jgi:ABC-type multidrug transport system fused ATPase/permease subunit